MQLLYTLTSYPPAVGGAQLHQHLLAQQLQKKHQIQVVTHWNQNRTDWLLGTTLKAPHQSENYEFEGINVHRLGLSWQQKAQIAPYIPIYYPLMNIVLPPIASCLQQPIEPFANQADLIHNVRIGREGLSYASYQIARKKGIPFVFTPLHHPRWVGWRYRAYIKLYQLADTVIALTNAEKKTLIDLGVEAEKIAVTGIGPILASQANPKQFLENYQINQPNILFLGQHYSYKGYQQLLQATQLVWEKVPEANFVFIGPSVKKSEKYFAKFSDPRIHRLGQVNLQIKTDALAACTLLCVPSSQESFGGVYTEAWSFSKPVIGCNIPAVSEVIADGVDGCLVSQTPEEIAENICELLLNPSQAEQMGQAGKQKVDTHYNWEALAEQTEQVYQKLI